MWRSGQEIGLPRLTHISVPRIAVQPITQLAWKVEMGAVVLKQNALVNIMGSIFL
jgi:hypothetical protein